MTRLKIKKNTQHNTVQHNTNNTVQPKTNNSMEEAEARSSVLVGACYLLLDIVDTVASIPP